MPAPRSRATAADGPDRPRHDGDAGGAPDGDARRVERAVRWLVDLALSAADDLEDRVPPAHLRALQALELSGPAQVSALAEATGLLPSTMSRLSDRLDAAGLITRGPSAANRRATVLEITAAGRDVLDELARLRAAELGAVLARMGDADRKALLDGVEAFAAAYRDAGRD